MITTRTELVAFWVVQGVNEGEAKAVAHAVFYMPPDEGTVDDLLRGWEFDSKRDAIITLTEVQAWQWYLGVKDEFEVEGDFILCFGEQAFKLDGTPLLV